MSKFIKSQRPDEPQPSELSLYPADHCFATFDSVELYIDLLPWLEK